MSSRTKRRLRDRSDSSSGNEAPRKIRGSEEVKDNLLIQDTSHVHESTCEESKDSSSKPTFLHRPEDSDFFFFEGYCTLCQEYLFKAEKFLPLSRHSFGTINLKEIVYQCQVHRKDGLHILHRQAFNGNVGTYQFHVNLKGMAHRFVRCPCGQRSSISGDKILQPAMSCSREFSGVLDVRVGPTGAILPTSEEASVIHSSSLADSPQEKGELRSSLSDDTFQTVFRRRRNVFSSVPKSQKEAVVELVTGTRSANTKFPQKIRKAMIASRNSVDPLKATVISLVSKDLTPEDETRLMRKFVSEVPDWAVACVSVGVSADIVAETLTEDTWLSNRKIRVRMRQLFGLKTVSTSDERFLKKHGKKRITKFIQERLSSNPWIRNLPCERLVFTQIPVEKTSLGDLVRAINKLKATPVQCARLVRKASLFRGRGLFLKRNVINTINKARAVDPEVEKLLRRGKSREAPASADSHGRSSSRTNRKRRDETRQRPVGSGSPNTNVADSKIDILLRALKVLLQ